MCTSIYLFVFIVFNQEHVLVYLFVCIVFILNVFCLDSSLHLLFYVRSVVCSDPLY